MKLRSLFYLIGISSLLGLVWNSDVLELGLGVLKGFGGLIVAVLFIVVHLMMFLAALGALALVAAIPLKLVADMLAESDRLKS